jgi:hypothetical protein
MFKQNRISKPHSIVFRRFQWQDSLKMGERGEKVPAVVFMGLIAVRRLAVPAPSEGLIERD